MLRPHLKKKKILPGNLWKTLEMWKIMAFCYYGKVGTLDWPSFTTGFNKTYVSAHLSFAEIV